MLRHHDAPLSELGGVEYLGEGLEYQGEGGWSTRERVVGVLGRRRGVEYLRGRIGVLGRGGVFEMDGVEYLRGRGRVHEGRRL